MQRDAKSESDAACGCGAKHPSTANGVAEIRNSSVLPNTGTYFWSALRRWGLQSLLTGEVTIATVREFA